MAYMNCVLMVYATIAHVIHTGEHTIVYTVYLSSFVHINLATAHHDADPQNIACDIPVALQSAYATSLQATSQALHHYSYFIPAMLL